MLGIKPESAVYKTNSLAFVLFSDLSIEPQLGLFVVSAFYISSNPSSSLLSSSFLLSPNTPPPDSHLAQASPLHPGWFGQDLPPPDYPSSLQLSVPSITESIQVTPEAWIASQTCFSI